MIAEGIVEVQVRIDLRKCVSDPIQLQVVVIWLNAFTGLSDGAVEVHSLGYCTVVFALYNSCEWTRTQITSSFETEDIIQEELTSTWGDYWP